jgi:hypothetical protein
MSVTRTSRTIEMTAAGDFVAGPLTVAYMRLTGSGMTAGQSLIVKHGVTSGGAVRARHVVAAANENGEVFEPQGEGDETWNQGIYLDQVPAAGTWTFTIRLK